MIDQKRKIILVHPPRCGGTTIEEQLTGKDWFLDNPHSKHLSASQTKLLCERLAIPHQEYFWIATTREPTERIQSMITKQYWYKGAKSGILALNISEQIVRLSPAPHENDNLTFRDYLQDLRYFDLILNITEIDSYLTSILGSQAIFRAEVSAPGKRIQFTRRQWNLTEYIFSDDYQFLGKNKRSLFGFWSTPIAQFDFLVFSFSSLIKTATYHLVYWSKVFFSRVSQKYT